MSPIYSELEAMTAEIARMDLKEVEEASKVIGDFIEQMKVVKTKEPSDGR